MTIYSARKAKLALLLAKEVILLTEYSDFADVFLEKSANVLLEQTRVNEHAIELKEGKQPPYGPIYSLGPVEFEILKSYFETNLANGFIRALKSPVGAPILFVYKPNDSFRLCVNYQGLNNLMIKNRYLLLLIGKFLDQLSQAKQFTQLDFTSPYHQIRIKEDNAWKTAFQTQYDHFKYQVMPFGLSNAPASFQDYINKILTKKLDIFVIVYLNDILIYTKEPGQAHVDAIWWVFEELRKNGLFANLKKCRFHKDKDRFLRYVMSAQGVQMEEERINVVNNWSEPKFVRDIQVFLVFPNSYHCFI